MRPHDNPPSTREKIQGVLNVLSSEEVCLDPNAQFTKAEMVKWCRTWIEIYDRLRSTLLCHHLHAEHEGPWQHLKTGEFQNLRPEFQKALSERGFVIIEQSAHVFRCSAHPA